MFLRMLRMEDFNFAQIQSLLPIFRFTFAQISSQFCPNLIKFAQKNLLDDAAAFPASPSPAPASSSGLIRNDRIENKKLHAIKLTSTPLAVEIRSKLDWRKRKIATAKSGSTTRLPYPTILSHKSKSWSVAR